MTATCSRVHYPSVGGHGCQTKVCGVVRAQELQNSHRLKRPPFSDCRGASLGHMDRLSTSDRMPLPPKTEAGSWTATLGRQWCRVGGMWPPETLCRPPEGRSWKKPESALTLTGGRREDPGSEDGRAGPEPQSPRAPGPDSQARLPHASLACPPSSPSLPPTDYSSLSSGVSCSAQAAAVSSVPWDGLYTCTKSREPVLYISP